MLYFIIAHSAEAQPVIQHFKMQRVYKFSYTMFEADNVRLIICNAGIDNAMMATSVLLAHYIPTNNDLLINIGICGAPGEIGTMLLVHKITHNHHSYFPDILFKHDLQEISLKTVDMPSANISDNAVDMEAYGIYKAASRFFKAHQMIFLKIISDNFQPESITKETAKKLISSKTAIMQNTINQALNVFKKDDILSSQEIELIKIIAKKLTKTQNDALLDACRYYKLHYKKPLPQIDIQPFMTKTTKQQRSTYLNELIQILTR